MDSNRFDFRTGRPTTITEPDVTADERLACSAINARRVRGILQVSQLSPSRESLPPDVWAAAFVRKTREWDVPLISLSKLGLIGDEDGFLESKTPDTFRALKSGAEACPYADYSTGVVYKLFFLPNRPKCGHPGWTVMDGIFLFVMGEKFPNGTWISKFIANSAGTNNGSGGPTAVTLCPPDSYFQPR